MDRPRFSTEFFANAGWLNGDVVLMSSSARPSGPVDAAGRYGEAGQERGVRGESGGPLRILLLEDSEADAELIAHELHRSGMTIMIGRVDTAEAFASALRSFAPDVVISDHSLGQFDSLAALEMVRAECPTVPFIIVAGAISGAQSVAAVRAGAEDLVLKSNLNRLGAAVGDAIDVRRPLQKLTSRQVQVLKLAAEGYRTRDIAIKLGLSVKTIESHRSEIMKRLQLHDVVSLARYAIRLGLIPSHL